MARKVFISFLGTTNYVECRYDVNGAVSEPVRFIQEALIRHYCGDWTAEDRILVFCTSAEKTGERGSLEINWLDNGHANVSSESEKIGLKHRLEDLKSELRLQPGVEMHEIQAGFSEEETWNIFEAVYSRLRSGDEIYFDVTHAFRSIPLFSVVLFNYSKFMLGTRIATIQYGAFEKLGARKAKELPVEERIAPVIDLTNIARLQEYNQIASELKYFGKVKKLKDVIAGDSSALADKAIETLAEGIAELDVHITTINLREIKSGGFIKKFRQNLKKVTKSNVIDNPIKSILAELNEETRDFVENDDYKNIEAAVNWTVRHDMLMQTYPLAVEYVIFRVSEELNRLKPGYMSEKKFKRLVGSILGMPQDDYENSRWKEDVQRYSDIAEKIADAPLIGEIRPLYDPIREKRNMLAHAETRAYSKLKKGIPDIIECLAALNSSYRNYPSTINIEKNV